MIKSERITATAAAAAIITGSEFEESVTIKNTGPNDTYLGGSDVTTANGYELPNGEKLTVTMNRTEKMYAVCAAAETANLEILRIS